MNKENKNITDYFNLIRYCRNHKLPNHEYPKFPFVRISDIGLFFSPHTCVIDLNSPKFIDYEIDKRLEKFEEEEKMRKWNHYEQLSLMDILFLNYKCREREINRFFTN